MNQNSFFGSAAGNADNKIWVLDADSDQMGSMEDHTLFKITPPEVDGVGDIRRVGNDLLIGQGVHYGSSVQDGAVSLVSTPLGANVNLSSQASVTWTGNAGSGFGSSLALMILIKMETPTWFLVPKGWWCYPCILFWLGCISNDDQWGRKCR